MQWLMRRLRNEDGNVLIIVAVFLTALTGLAALGADVGRLYVVRQRLSVVADAAALAGAQFLPDDQPQAITTATAYLTKNGIDLNDATVSIHPDGRTVDVDIDRAVPTAFARLAGPQFVAVRGSAGASSMALSSYLGAVPFGVPKDNWKLGQPVDLKLGAGATSSPGNFMALALGGNGANTYQNNIMYGYSQWLHIGDPVTTKPGNMAGPTDKGVQYRIDQDPHATYETVSRNSPRLLMVPIIDNFNVNGRAEVQIVGFGMFFLEPTSSKGSVQGRFCRYVGEGEGSVTAPGYGTYTNKLTR